ncbi:MAG: Mth938-like domain-containing protein [Gammaproteobacteria bacterium]
MDAMKFNLDTTDDLSVAAYAAGWVRVGEHRIDRPCLLSAAGILTDGLPPRPEDLGVAHLDLLRHSNPEIVLVGTGARQVFVDYATIEALADEGIALECMDTGAACRSYNILRAEARAVAALLYML